MGKFGDCDSVTPIRHAGVMEHDLNLSTLAKHFSDEESAWELVEKMRWPNGPECPHCGSDRAYFLKPRAGQRTTAKGAISYRRWWKCANCRKQFSVLVGTIFENSKVPLSKWLMAVYLMTASKNGLAANELRRTLGVSQRTAWHMTMRVREAMKAGPLADMLRGTIVADETWIGGNPKNRHGVHEGEPVKPRENRHTDKTPVLSLISAETGEIRSRVVPDIAGATLRKVMAENVDMAGSVLHTDEGGWYNQLGREFIEHNAVNHSAGEYVRGNVTTNQAEGYFSQLKRSLDGTHHGVSRAHLGRYVAEFDFRYSTCKLSDSARMTRLMGQTGGRRLTYNALTGRQS